MKNKNITCIYQAFAQRFVEAPLVAITASSLEKLNNNECGASACFQISPETFNQVHVSVQAGPLKDNHSVVS